LVGKLKNKTRGQAQKMIASGEVLVLGKMRNRHYALKSGEIVEVKKIVGTQNLAFLRYEVRTFLLSFDEKPKKKRLSACPDITEIYYKLYEFKVM